jgi:hypothetical protein
VDYFTELKILQLNKKVLPRWMVSPSINMLGALSSNSKDLYGWKSYMKLHMIPTIQATYNRQGNKNEV